MNGIQLAFALTFCVPICLIALEFGRTGAVTALMVASLPITLLQTPGRIMLNREMRYDRQLAIDVFGQMSFQLFAVVAVLLGAGVWGLAFASVVRAVAGTLLTRLLTARVGPSFAARLAWLTAVLVRFGLKLSGELVYVGRPRTRAQHRRCCRGGGSSLGDLDVYQPDFRSFLRSHSIRSTSWAFPRCRICSLEAKTRHRSSFERSGERRSSRRFVFPSFTAAARTHPVIFGEHGARPPDILPFICLSTSSARSPLLRRVTSPPRVAGSSRGHRRHWALSGLE